MVQLANANTVALLSNKDIKTAADLMVGGCAILCHVGGNPVTNHGKAKYSLAYYPGLNLAVAQEKIFAGDYIPFFEKMYIIYPQFLFPCAAEKRRLFTVS